MSRVDTARPVRALAAAVFAYESAALVESLAAETRGTPPRFLTVSAHAWRRPAVVPIVCAALAVHLYLKPPNQQQGATL